MAELLLGRTPETNTDVSVKTDDLVTHGVIVGMTGSGKTGLGIGLIEECLNAGVPCLIVDPKGDLTNLALVFPGLSGPEFEPWVDPAQAKEAGTPAFAEQQAAAWKQGLAPWGIAEPQMAEFKAKFDVAIFTPGSNAGTPLNVLGSLKAPQTDDQEVVTDEIEGYVTSLLSVVGISADPLSSREHILLSNLIASAWAAGEDIDLPTLLARVNQPPMRKLGVFDLDEFFPPKERLAFAMRLNAVLAAPTFANWITGQPIDIEAMLRTPEGKPRAAIVTTAHLSDEDRQSATSLVLSKFVTWMRRQSGTTDLRALLYMDEVAGYLPPTANPPTKKPIMLLMKQARAFGIGVVLSTQNPVDVDYKAISNAGTWMIGRLTTENDKARLLEGMPSSTGLSDAISGLGKRQFLIRKAGADDTETFATRWVRSYLRGPMTRDQIQQVMADAAPAPAPVAVAAPVTEPEPAAADDETPVMPAAAAEIPVSYLDPAAAWSAQVGAVAAGPTGPRLEAAAVARVILRYQLAKADVAHDEEYEAVIHPLPEQTISVNPLAVDYDDRDLLANAPANARYVIPAAKIGQKTYWSTLQKDLADYLVAHETLEVMHNPELKLYSRVGETPEEFASRCQQVAMAEADKKAVLLRKKYETKLRTLQTRLNTASGQAQQASAAASSSVMDSAASVLGGFLSGRRSVSSIGAAARRTQSANARAQTAQAKVGEVQAQIQDLEADLTDELAALKGEWEAKALSVEPIEIAVKRTQIRVTDLRLVWIPVG
ncbi:MAG: DUF853 family protein [Candidatus Nanopelagicales bacterium]|nr:DUF853 family protein [Candidatus Nanopelagicales bacterium]